MEKFTKLEKGTFVKDGKEYDYIVEIAENFPKEKAGNIRIRIIEERPAIRKIRTRYDPEITMYGDKDASIELALGYDMKNIKKALRYLLFSSLFPFYFTGIILMMVNVDKIPKTFFPTWILLPMVLVLTLLSFRLYYKMNMTMLAEYLKSRDLRKILDKEGFRQ